jgi:hypothetical protein
MLSPVALEVAPPMNHKRPPGLPMTLGNKRETRHIGTH